jgi:hypothetical protein
MVLFKNTLFPGVIASEILVCDNGIGGLHALRVLLESESGKRSIEKIPFNDDQFKQEDYDKVVKGLLRKINNREGHDDSDNKN